MKLSSKSYLWYRPFSRAKKYKFVFSFLGELMAWQFGFEFHWTLKNRFWHFLTKTFTSWIHKLLWFPLIVLIFGQKSCFLGPSSLWDKKKIFTNKVMWQVNSFQVFEQGKYVRCNTSDFVVRQCQSLQPFISRKGLWLQMGQIVIAQVKLYQDT